MQKSDNTKFKELPPKSHSKLACNPFRYLDLYQLEKLLYMHNADMPEETKAYVKEAIREKKISK